MRAGEQEVAAGVEHDVEVVWRASHLTGGFASGTIRRQHQIQTLADFGARRRRACGSLKASCRAEEGTMPTCPPLELTRRTCKARMSSFNNTRSFCTFAERRPHVLLIGTFSVYYRSPFAVSTSDAANADSNALPRPRPTIAQMLRSAAGLRLMTAPPPWDACTHRDNFPQDAMAPAHVARLIRHPNARCLLHPHGRLIAPLPQ